MGERRLADPAERKRGDGDAELSGGEISVEIVDGALEREGVRAPGGNQLGDAAAAHRHQRELSGDEEAVRRHENEDRYDSKHIGPAATAIDGRHALLSGLSARLEGRSRMKKAAPADAAATFGHPPQRMVSHGS